MRRKYRRLNFLKAIISWLIVLGYVFLIPPSSVWSYIFFYLLILLTFNFSLSLILADLRSFIYSLLIVVILIFKQQDLDNWLNYLLLLATVVTIELYFRKA